MKLHLAQSHHRVIVQFHKCQLFLVYAGIPARPHKLNSVRLCLEYIQLIFREKCSRKCMTSYAVNERKLYSKLYSPQLL